jgi:hypothetical protein
MAAPLSCPSGSVCWHSQFAGPAWGHVHMAPETLDWFLRCARAAAARAGRGGAPLCPPGPGCPRTACVALPLPRHRRLGPRRCPQCAPFILLSSRRPAPQHQQPLDQHGHRPLVQGARGRGLRGRQGGGRRRRGSSALLRTRHRRAAAAHEVAAPPTRRTAPRRPTRWRRCWRRARCGATPTRCGSWWASQAGARGQRGGLGGGAGGQRHYGVLPPRSTVEALPSSSRAPPAPALAAPPRKPRPAPPPLNAPPPDPRAQKGLRVAEINSISNSGLKGVSDTMAGALWSLDATLEVAAAGATGVNFHCERSGRGGGRGGGGPGGRGGMAGGISSACGRASAWGGQRCGPPWAPAPPDAAPIWPHRPRPLAPPPLPWPRAPTTQGARGRTCTPPSSAATRPASRP